MQKSNKEYNHFKLIDGRSGNPMGFTYKVEKGTTIAQEKLNKILHDAAMKKSCPPEMIELQAYQPRTKRKRLN